jgi:hypothetical protein
MPTADRRIFIILALSIVILFPASIASNESTIASGSVEARPTYAGGSGLTWISFEDPFEKAFTLEVPRGWTVRGGLFRLGFSDERPMVDLISADGRVKVRLGDLSIPVYTAPNQYHGREGEIYDLGAQARLVVAKYRSGPEFAVLYSHVRFYQECRDAAADAANVDFTIPDYIPSEGVPARTSNGQIAYRCGSGEQVVYAFARTTSTGDIWSVPTLGSFLSPPDQVGLARSVLEHCAQTFKLSPEWIEHQKQLDAYALQYQRARQQQRMQELGQQVQQFEAKMQAMRDQVSAFERHQNAQSAQVEGFSQALRGVTPTIDPFTGEAKEVWTGPNGNYWTNGVGGVVNSTNAPAAGWRQMQVTGP